MRLLLFCVASAICAAQIPLWPDKDFGTEHDTTTAKDGLIAGKRVIRLGNVSKPEITLYRPAKNNSGTAILVFPGGGYNILAMDLEGTEVCEWLQSIGVTGVLLKYRVPGRSGAFEDAQKAISMVREHAAEWAIDPKRVGVLGFSKPVDDFGGHRQQCGAATQLCCADLPRVHHRTESLRGYAADVSGPDRRRRSEGRKQPELLRSAEGREGSGGDALISIRRPRLRLAAHGKNRHDLAEASGGVAPLVRIH